MSELASQQSPEPADHAIAPRWLVRLCRPSRVAWLAPLLGFALASPSIFGGYVQDDHALGQYALDTSIYAKRPAWDCFNWLSSAVDVARYRERSVAQVSWWTPDTARARFFRPLASLLHAFEFTFFGEVPWIMHVNRVLLYALIVLLGVKLLQRFSSTPLTWAIACLLFAVDDVHAFSAGWISGADTLLTCVFGLFALLMHDRWRRDRTSAGLALSLAAFILSLLSSEGGLALMGYLVAYGLFLDEGRWPRRIAALIPATIVAVGYIAFYLTQHLGMRGSFDYLAPFEDLLQTARVVLAGLVTGTLSQVLSLPPLTLMLQFVGGAGVLVAAALLAVLVAALWRFLGSSKRVAFFGAGLVLSMLPFTVGMMSDRYLLWASLGGAGLLGELFAAYNVTSKLQRITAKTLLATNAVVSLLFFMPSLFWLSAIETNIRRLEELVPAEDTVVLNTNLIPIMAAAAIRYEKGHAWPEHFYFRKNLAALAWIRATSKGHERFQVPAVGEELRVRFWLWD